MVLTVVIAALAVCGVVLIAWALFETFFQSLSEHNAFFVVYLRGEAGQVQQTIRSCLRLRDRRGLRCRLVFVDGGIDAEGQNAAELLLRGESAVTLCAPAQLQEIFQWENGEIESGTD